MPFDNKLSVIDICDACCDNLNELKTFWGTLYAAVQALVECPIAAPSHLFTLKCCGQEVPCLARTEHINLSHSNGSLVLHCTTTKSIMTWFTITYQNEDVISFIPNSEFLKPHGSRYQILQYPYIEGNHKLDTPLQAATAVRELNKFHEKDFVHGDIRSLLSHSMMLTLLKK